MSRKTVSTAPQDTNIALDPNDKKPAKTVKTIVKAAGAKPGAKAAAAKPATKPAAKATAAKPAAPKEPVQKETRNIGEVEMGDLPKGLTDILPEEMLRILGEAKPDVKEVNFGIGTLPNDLGFVRVYPQEKLVTITDPEHLPHGFVRLESNKTLGSKLFYIHTMKMTGHPEQSEYTNALRDAYDVAISEALRDGGWADFVPSAIATIGVVQEISPWSSMYSLHEHPRLQRPDQLYSTRPVGDYRNRNTLSVCTRSGETDFMFILDNLMEVNTSNNSVQHAIAMGYHLVTVTIGERNFTASVTMDNYPLSLTHLNQTLLLEYLNDAVRALLVTAWFDKLVGDVVVSEFVYTKTNVNL